MRHANTLCSSFALPLILSASIQAQETDVISVTASRVERGTAEVASSIAVIDAERIESAKMFNIKDAVQGVPGVLIDSKNGGYDVRMMIRGAGQKANYGVREIMVLRDGVPMTDPDSFSRFDFIDTQDIERIEITKGPGSLYGAGSAGGTVQIISKSVFDLENRVKLGAGELGSRLLHGRYGSALGEAGAWSLTASRRELDNDWRDWNRFDTSQFALKHGWMFEDGSVLESELSYSEADMQLPASMTEDEFKAFEDTGEQHATSSPWQRSGRYSTIWFFNSRLEQELGPVLFKPRLYFNRWEHFHPVTGAINDNPGTDVFGADLEFVLRHELWGDSTLVAGVTGRVDDTPDSRKYKYADIEYNPYSGRIASVTSDRSGDLLQKQDTVNQLIGVYLQETFSPTQALNVDIGLRADRSSFDISTQAFGEYSWGAGDYVDFAAPRYSAVDKTFDLLSPRLGLTYALSDGLNLYGSLARSDQVPSQSEIEENPDLDAAAASNLELGLKGRARDWSFDLAVYQTQVEDEIVSVLNGYQTEFENAGQTDKRGAEFSGRLRLMDRLWLGVGYAFSDYTFDDFQEPVYGQGNLDRSGNQIPYIPRHQYSLSLDYASPLGWQARLSADGWGEYYMDNANTEKYAGYDLLTNLMVGYELGPHSLSLNVDNLFDKRYAVEVKKNTSGDKTYSAGAPRSALLSYRYRF